MDKARKLLLMEAYGAFLDSEYADDVFATGSDGKYDPEDAVQSGEVPRGDSYNIAQVLNPFPALVGEMQSNQAALEGQIKRIQREREQLTQEKLRLLFLELLDLRDNLEGGVLAAKSYRMYRIRLWFRKRETRLIKGLRDGQGMTLKRLDHMLAAHQIRPITTLGEKFDPHAMRVVDTVKQDHVRNGIVTKELGKGFYWGEDVLRVADVIVNKLSVISK